MSVRDWERFAKELGLGKMKGKNNTIVPALIWLPPSIWCHVAGDFNTRVYHWLLHRRTGGNIWGRLGFIPVPNFCWKVAIFGERKSCAKVWIVKCVQVDLYQKLFFLQNMGRTCCVQKLFWMSETISVNNMFSPGLSLEFSCIELVIQWIICRHIEG